MEFLSIREFSKAPAAALARLARDGKAVLTNNGKPAAIMLNASAENFERVFSFIQQVEKNVTLAQVHTPQTGAEAGEQEWRDAFERLMNFPRKKLPDDFDYKKELMEAIDERKEMSKETYQLFLDEFCGCIDDPTMAAPPEITYEPEREPVA